MSIATDLLIVNQRYNFYVDDVVYNNAKFLGNDNGGILVYWKFVFVFIADHELNRVTLPNAAI